MGGMGSGRTKTKLDRKTPRLCKRCGETKPTSEFYTRTQSWVNKNGSMSVRIYYVPHCKACDLIRHNEWCKTPAGKIVVARNNKKGWERDKKNPQRLAERRQYAKEWHRKQGQAYRDYYRYLRPLMK